MGIAEIIFLSVSGVAVLVFVIYAILYILDVEKRMKERGMSDWD